MSILPAEICRGFYSVFDNKRTCPRRGPSFKSGSRHVTGVGGLCRSFHEIWVKWYTISLQYRSSLHNQFYWTVAYRPSKRLKIAHVVRYLAALCGRQLVTHQFLKALTLEGNLNISIQSQTTPRHDHSCKCDANYRIKQSKLHY